MGGTPRAFNRLSGEQGPDAKDRPEPRPDPAGAPDRVPEEGASTESGQVHSRRIKPRSGGGDSEKTRSEGWILELTATEQAWLGESLSGLTDREREVLFAICAGGTNEQLADRLCIALPTLRTHLMRLNQKLGSTSKGDVVRFIASNLLEGYRSGRIIPPALRS